MGQLSVGGVSAQFRPVLALLTESGTYTVPYAGWYRIIAIGHGAGGYGDDSAPLSTPAPGGAGGGGYLDKYLPAGAVLTATISDMASTLSYGGSALISAARGSGKTAGSVTGSGVVAFPSNGTDTPDVTPPDGIYDASFRSVGGAAGLRDDEAVSAAGGAGTEAMADMRCPSPATYIPATAGPAAAGPAAELPATCILLAVPRAITPGPEAEAATAEEAASRPQSATTPTIPAGWVRGPAARDACASSASDNF